MSFITGILQLLLTLSVQEICPNQQKLRAGTQDAPLLKRARWNPGVTLLTYHIQLTQIMIYLVGKNPF